MSICPALPGGLTRPDFGDASLYLADGVTTVINLGGDSTQIEWRRRIESGDLLGPTVYTSGPFVNEPRVNTPEDVQHEVATQARQGYDLIKFHENCRDDDRAFVGGLPHDERDRAHVGIPLVGHAPVNLGLDVLLQERQSLAHMGMLGNIFFLPLQSNVRFVAVTATAIVLLTLVVFKWDGAAMVAWLRKAAAARRLSTLSRVRTMARWVVLVSLAGVAAAGFFLPGGPLFESITLRALHTTIALFIAVASLLLWVLTARLWRDTNASLSARMQASLVSVATLALAFSLAVFWYRSHGAALIVVSNGWQHGSTTPGSRCKRHWSSTRPSATPAE
jgi:hypothetical protein